MFIDKNRFYTLYKKELPKQLEVFFQNPIPIPLSFSFKDKPFILEIQEFLNLDNVKESDIKNQLLPFAINSDGFKIYVDLKDKNLALLQEEYGDIDSICIGVEELKNIQKDESLISKFTELFLQTSGDGYALDVPKDMQKGKMDSDGWCEWKATNSSVSSKDFNSIENRIGFIFPNSFKEYFTYKNLLMTDFLVRLPQTPSDNPLGELKEYLAFLDDPDSFFKVNSLIPFAYDGDERGTICFCKKDSFIILVDSSKVLQDNYQGEKFFDSFDDLIKAIIDELESYQ